MGELAYVLLLVIAKTFAGVGGVDWSLVMMMMGGSSRHVFEQHARACLSGHSSRPCRPRVTVLFRCKEVEAAVGRWIRPCRCS